MAKSHSSLRRSPPQSFLESSTRARRSAENPSLVIHEHDTNSELRVISRARANILRPISLNEIKDTLRAWRVTSYRDSLSKYETIFYDLHKIQNDFHWTSDVLNVLSPNLFFTMSALPDASRHIVSMFTMIRALINLDDIVENYLGACLSDTFAIRNNPEFISCVNRQQTMEHVHKVTYLRNLSSAAEIHWESLVSEYCANNPSLARRASTLGTTSLLKGLDAYMEQHTLRSGQTAHDMLCEQLKNLADGVREKIIRYMASPDDVMNNNNPDAVRRRIIGELNIRIIFLCIEFIILPVLICNVLSFDRLHFSAAILRKQIEQMMKFIEKNISRNTDKLNSASCIAYLLEPNELMTPIEVNGQNKYTNLYGMRIANQEILRDEFIHVMISLSRIKELINMLLDIGVTPTQCHNLLDELTFDEPFMDIITEFLVNLTCDVERYTITQMRSHITYILHTVLIKPVGHKMLKVTPNVQMRPSQLSLRMMDYLNSHIITSQHESLSASYTNQLFGRAK